MSYVLDDTRYESWSELEGFLDHYYNIVRGEERVKQSLALVEGDDVLDMGCWAGTITYLLAQRHKRVVGVDVNADCIEIAKRKYLLPNTEFILTDGGLKSLQGRKFDSVVALELIEHLKQPLEFLRDVRVLLKPGGFLIISTPNAVSYIILARSLLRRIPKYIQRIDSWPIFTTDQRSHFYLWDIFTLYRMVSVEGFSYVEHRFVDNYNSVSRIFSNMPVVRCFLSTIVLKVQYKGD
ncbi:MAG: class I SAM-dependent methyltransferase [Candidatus Hodarchaeota archaeon]